MTNHLNSGHYLTPRKRPTNLRLVPTLTQQARIPGTVEVTRARHELELQNLEAELRKFKDSNRDLPLVWPKINFPVKEY